MASKREFWSQTSVREVVAASQQAHSSQEQSSAPLPPGDLPDLVPHAPTGEPAECDVDDERKGRKRSEAEIQLEMYNKGAFFFRFETPTADPKGRTIEQSKGYTAGINNFRVMESKGFRVATDGCLIPHEHYCTPKKGAVLKGHQRSTYFFTGLTPQANTGKKNRKTIRDADGWPTDSQISHLCHRRQCCRPDHLQFELRVCNIRRNYCGILSKLGDGEGGCDCGMVPPCVRPYSPECSLESVTFCTTRQQVALALDGLKDRFPYRLLDRDDVRKVALKADNAKKRKDRGAKHEAAARKRQSKGSYGTSTMKMN